MSRLLDASSMEPFDPAALSAVRQDIVSGIAREVDKALIEEAGVFAVEQQRRVITAHPYWMVLRGFPQDFTGDDRAFDALRECRDEFEARVVMKRAYLAAKIAGRRHSERPDVVSISESDVRAAMEGV